MSNNITCPSCGHTFSLSDVQKHELQHMREQMKGEIEAEMKKRAFAYAQDEIKKAKQEADEAMKKAERDTLEKNQKQLLELETLRKRDEEARTKEMAFLRKEQEMEMRQKNLEIEKEKAIIEARKEMEADLSKQAGEKVLLEVEKMARENEKKMAEKEQQLEQLRRSLEDANRKATQGSMQIQGEIQEDALKSMLQSSFPVDIVSDVEKGIKGADIIQEIRNEFGQSVGIIAWESKNTKAWEEKWVDKLKEDRLRVNADISILVTAVLPKGVEKFGLYKGVWLVEWAYVLPIANMLRGQIESMAHLRSSLVSKDEKMEVVYNYLTSAKFKDKVENIIDAFRQMQDQVAEERRAFEKRWKMRESLLEQVIKNTGGMYGDLGGILGGKLPPVGYLELDSGEI